MRHQSRKKILGRKRGPKKALMKSLVRNFIEYKSIKTTLPKARFCRSFVERLITRAKKEDLSTRRYLLRYLTENQANKLIKEIAPKYKDKKSGYTRITKIGFRKGDGAVVVKLELT